MIDVKRKINITFLTQGSAHVSKLKSVTEFKILYSEDVSLKKHVRNFCLRAPTVINVYLIHFFLKSSFSFKGSFSRF